MKKVINFIFSNFVFFLFLLSILIISNKVLIFKLANNNISDTYYILAFKSYLEHKKITFLTKKIEKVNKSILFSNLKNDSKIRKFDEKLFYQMLQNYKNFSDWVYKVLGFSLLFLVYKFFRKVRF